MKRLYSNFWMVILFVALAITSCDSFLDVKPVGKVIPETYEDFRGVLTGAYDQMPGNRSLSTLRTDEVMIDPNSWQEPTGLIDIYIWNDALPDPSTLAFSYQTYYKAIFNANHIINEGQNVTNSQEGEIDQLLGESYLLRAYMYFYLVNSYADQYDKDKAATTPGVPIVLDVDLERDQIISNVDKVYEQIVNDIEKAISLINIEEQEKGFNYRFSKVSAYGFASRVYLFMNNEEKAIEFADKALAINKTLIDFNALTDEDVKPYHFESEENILALEQTFASSIANDVVVSEKMNNAYNHTGDTRYTVYIDGGRPSLGKFSENKVSMRTSEFYLNKAEALVKLNKDEDAKTVLLSLLTKRLTPSYYAEQEIVVKALNNTDLLQYVWDERYRELAFQGFRWFDLRRTTQPEITKVYKGETYVLNQKDPRYTLRFPQEAVDNNPNLTN